jgi:hypothetical protein
MSRIYNHVKLQVNQNKNARKNNVKLLPFSETKGSFHISNCTSRDLTKAYISNSNGHTQGSNIQEVEMVEAALSKTLNW